MLSDELQNAGKYCMDEFDCKRHGVDLPSYERGVADAVMACRRIAAERQHSRDEELLKQCEEALNAARGAISVCEGEGEMNLIVARLRTAVEGYGHNASIFNDAADLIEQQAARIDDLEADLWQVLNERDAAEERGTSLAEAVGEHFRVEVGEHSSMNDPLAMAIAILEGEYITDSDTDRKLSAANALIERNKATFKRICEVKFSNWSDEWMRNRAKDQATAIERYQKGEQG